MRDRTPPRYRPRAHSMTPDADDPVVFERGCAYTRAQISARLGGSRRACLPTKDGIVLAACLLQSLNPEAPRVVLCGTGPRNAAMGGLLARQTSPIPVFIKAGVGHWVYAGLYVVGGSATHGARFERHLAASTRTRASVSRVVWLAAARRKRARPARRHAAVAS